MIETAVVLLHASTGALAGIAALMLFVPGARASHTTAEWLALAALGCATAAAVGRWVVTGHPPVFGTFENTIASAWAILALLGLARFAGRPGWLTRIDRALLLLWVPVTVVWGFGFSREPYPLTISERSLLVDIHVAFAWAAYVVLLAGCMRALRLVADRRREPGPDDDRALTRSAGIGFTLFSGLMLVGAIYSFQLFADFYTWEIVEAFAAATWLAYALILHARLLFGWRSRRLAWAVLATLPLLVATFWIWSVFSGTYHFFEITEIRA